MNLDDLFTDDEEHQKIRNGELNTPEKTDAKAIHALPEMLSALKRLEYRFKRPNESQKECTERLSKLYFEDTGIILPEMERFDELYELDEDDDASAKQFNNWLDSLVEDARNALMKAGEYDQ